MTVSWDELPRPAIIAHRGASAYKPENTLAAFNLAVQQHADAVELDAKLTADGKIVVMHDDTVDRTTNGHGAVREANWKDLSVLYSGADTADTHIPLLAEVLEAVTPYLMVNIELTNYAAPFDDLPEKVAALVRELGVESRVWVSSFNPIALWRFSAALSEVPTGYLMRPRSYALWLMRAFVPHRAVHPHFSLVTPERVQTWHRRGKRVYVYTVNDADKMRTLFSMGVDGIFTDDPPLAQKVRDEIATC